MVNDDLTVFISYRRADSSADAGRLYDALRRRFGRESLFMDVDSLRPGEDWVDAVEAAVTRCDVVLAIIGPAWVGAKNDEGEFRLHNELDRVRLEIEAGLRNQKPVIPVLVEGASMPTSDQLPDSLKPLLRRHAIRISHSTFESDLSALVRALRTIDKQRHPKPAHAATGAAAPAASPPPTATSAPVTAPLAAPAPPESTPPITQPYVAPTYVPPPPTPPIPPLEPVYPAPSAQPAYPYQAPAYGYAGPAPRKGLSPLALGLVGVVVVVVIGVVLMAGLHLGPFALTAVSTPTPTLEPTDQPTDQPTPQPTNQPTDQPTSQPTSQPTAQPTVEPTPSSPTASAGRTPYPDSAFDPLWAVVPLDVRDNCQQSSNYDVPNLFCYVTSGEETFSFWYATYPDVASLNTAYNGWLQFQGISREVANCFDESAPVPCEGPYKVNGYDPAGRVAGLVSDGGWMYWTHEPALIFGTGYADVTGGVPFADLFAYWENSAGYLNIASPPPSP